MDELSIRPGEIIATRYRVESQVGRGGASVVYRAVDLRHDRPVAVKLLDPRVASEVASHRFLQEIRIEAHLQHPNIVPLHDSGVWKGQLFCVMPLIDGETLRDRIRHEGALPIDETIRISCELAEALDYAHRQGVVHRDVKPENILLHEGHPLLTDFGISRALEASLQADHTLTTPGIAVGTPAYMSPEQASGESSLDGRSDFYSLGCVLYEMLTGEAPFRADTPVAMIGKHLSAEVTPVSSLRPRVPANIAATAERLLEKNPADRLSTGDEICRALRGEAKLKRRSRPLRKAHWAVGALTIIGFATLLFAWPEDPKLDRDRILVFPLEERTLLASESGAGVEAAYMVSTALELAEPLKTLDAERHMDAGTDGKPPALDPAEARQLAEQLGAGRLIEGSVRRDTDSLRIVLVLRDTEGDSMIARRSAAIPGAEASIASLSLAAVRELLPELIDPGRAANLNLDALGTHHPSALALYFQGERAYRSFRMSEALDFFERAIEADSTLVIAAARGAQAANWEHEYDSASRLASLALSRAGELLPKYSAYARGLDAYLKGAAVEAESALLGALELDPDWPEAHAALGEVYYHLQPRAFNLDSLAAEHFRAAIEADSAYAVTRVHLAEMAARRGDLAETDEHVAVLSTYDADPEVIEKLQLMRGCVEGTLGTAEWRGAADRNELTAFDAMKSLSEGAWRPGCASDGARVLLSPPERGAGVRLGALWILQGLYVSRGKGNEARALLDSAMAVDETDLLQLFYVVNTVAGLPMQDGAMRTDSMLRADDGEYFDDLTGTPLWSLGVWNAWRGDTIQASRVREAIGDLADSGECLACGSLAAAIDGHMRLAAGDSAGALAIYDTLFPAGRLERMVWRFAEPLPAVRLKQAELHAAREEHFEAIRAASLLDGRPAVYLPFLARSLEIRHQQALAWGDRRMAEMFRERLERLGLTPGQAIPAPFGIAEPSPPPR
jgi:tetratricopeptide (TPR) repeat protein